MIRRVYHLSNRLFSTGRPSASINCPACQSRAIQIKEDVFCCKACPNRQGIDYFSLLGLPRTYSVDLKAAEGNYREMQRTFHPDKLSSVEDNSIPEGFSALLNKAIGVIKSPTARCMHLLYLLDGCSISESQLTNDPALLMEMMEINEEIEDCGRDKSCLENQANLNQTRFNESEAKLKDFFASKRYSEARKECERMHYLERIKDTLVQKLNSV